MKKVFSVQISIIFMLIFAFSCAVGTFVENEYGSKVAYSLVYNSLWFEAIILFLALATIFNIYTYKMYKIKKLSTLLVHLSFLLLFIGAILTRYYGFEGSITIEENAKNNIVKSYDEYVILDNDMKKISVKDLINKDFNFSNNDYEVKLVDYVQNAKEELQEDSNEKAIVHLYLSSLNGYESLFLKEDSLLKKDNYTIDFKNEKKSNKISINLKKQNNNIYIKSNINYSVSSKDNNNINFEKDTWNKLLKGYVYQIGQLNFLVADFLPSAKIVLKQSFQNMSKDAITLQIKKDNQKELINVYKNEPKELSFGLSKINISWGSKDVILPFDIYLKDFILKKYPGSNSPSEFKSDIKVYENGNFMFDYTIFMNNVLDYKGYRFFQSSYKADESATILSVNKDLGKIPTYIGYSMLFLGLILNLFSKNSRFYKLVSTKYTLDNIALIALLVLFFNQSFLFSNEIKPLEIQKQYASKFSKVLVQDYQGRIKPIDTLSLEIFNKVSKSSKNFGLDRNQLFLSMLIYPQYWQNIEFIKIKNKELATFLGQNEKKFISYLSLYDEEGRYKLEEKIFEANSKRESLKNEFDKEVIKLDERVNIIYNLFSGAFLKIFPLAENENSKWIDPTLLFSNEEFISVRDKENITVLMNKLLASFENMDDFKALDEISSYQKDLSKDIIPSDFKVSQEVLFNDLNIFDRLIFIYLVIGFVLFLLFYINIFIPSKKVVYLYNSFKVLLYISFLLHTYGLALRWYISSHAPWSNGYESMIYISWAVIVAGLIFSKRSFLSLSMSSILSAITLFVAHLNWLEPQITNLTPVLKSYWLSIHVSVITASYGFFGLSAILAFFTLVLFVFYNQNKDNLKSKVVLLSIKESRRVNELSVILGIVFLVIGNFLGAIWANESWGRYWGWDPKETWTLISILIYSAIFHLEYTRFKLNEYYFSLLTLGAFCSIVMTYFGVNYYLSGMHSYASGDPLPIPVFIPISLIVIIIVSVLGYKNRRI